MLASYWFSSAALTVIEPVTSDSQGWLFSTKKPIVMYEYVADKKIQRNIPP